MAVTGVFLADFASFYDAVQKAEVHLKSFESGSAKVGKQLDQMADSFSGRKVISEATLMAEAIREMGGLSKLTGSELQRAGIIADEAAEKLRKLGRDVPPGIERLSNAAKDANPNFATLRSTFSQFDDVLSASGINITRQVKALDDISRVSGQTAASLGTLATAGLAAGAGLAGWQTGRWIAEITGADDAIAGFTARLLGFGDVQAESAAALKESYVNAELARIAFQKQAEAATDWSGRLERARGFVQGLNDAQIDQIQLARQLGATQEQLTKQFGLSADAVKVLDDRLEASAANSKKLEELEKQIASAKKKRSDDEARAAEQNAKKFSDLTQENLAIELSIIGTKDQAKAASIEAEFQREVAKLNKLDTKYQEYYAALERQRDLRLERESANYEQINAISRTAMQERADQELNTLNAMLARSGEFSQAQIAQQRETWFEALEAVRNFGLGAEQVLEDISKKAKEEADRITAFMNAATLNSRQSQSFTTDIPALTGNALADVVSRFRQAGDTTQAQSLKRALATLEANEGTQRPTDNASFFELQRDAVLLAQLRQLVGTGRVPGFANGVTNFRGGLAVVGERGPELVRLPGGSDVIPNGSVGAPVFVINVTAGLGDRYTIAQSIKEVLVAEYKSLGYRAPVGGSA